MFPLNEMQYSYINLLLMSQLYNNQGNPYQASKERPQTEGQSIKVSAPTPPFQQTDSKISDERPQKTQKTVTKSSLDEIEQKRSTQPSKPEVNEIPQLPKQKVKQPVKPKRPQNYLTERAYYMKQKLKSKQRADKRILRRRPKEKQKPTVRVALRSGEQKKKNQVTKASSKNKMIKKQYSPCKEKKYYEKLQLRVAKEYVESSASRPWKIIGIWQLNQFCRQKMESLMKRRILL